MNIHTIILAAAEAATQSNSGGVLGTLGVNWKLFLAQLINFCIVLFIFWKWIVKPLGEALTKRQEKIESGLHNAEYMEKEKQNFEQWRMNEMRKTRDEADKILKGAIVDAEKIKSETVGVAHTQAAKLIEQTKASLAQEKESMMKEIRTDVATLVVAASEKILRSKLDEKKDKDLIAISLKDLE